MNGICNDQENAYNCSCFGGFTDPDCTTDIDECVSDPCVHGDCVNSIDSYLCMCNAGYVGEDCSVEIDECSSSPCADRQCVDAVGSYACACQAGYIGLNCATEMDECSSNPCVYGICNDALNSFTCACDVGFGGVHCESAVSTAGLYWTESNRFNGISYAASDTRSSWTAARDACDLDNATLAIVTSTVYDTFLKQQFIDTNIRYRMCKSCPSVH